jgi:hypothetical protein
MNIQSANGRTGFSMAHCAEIIGQDGKSMLASQFVKDGLRWMMWQGNGGSTEVHRYTVEDMAEIFTGDALHGLFMFGYYRMADGVWVDMIRAGANVARKAL